MIILRRYGADTVISGIPLITRNAMDFKSSPTLETGDVKYSVDDGSQSDFSPLSDYVTVAPSGSNQVKISLNAGLMCAKRLVITFIDQSTTKEWEDQRIIVETYGDPDAQHPYLGQSIGSVDVATIKGDDIITYEINSNTVAIAAVAPSGNWLTDAGVWSDSLAYALDQAASNISMYLDTSVSSRLAESSYIPPANTEINETLEKVGNIQETASETLETMGEIQSLLQSVYNGGSGAHHVTVTVTDGTNPLPGVLVRINRSGEVYALQTQLDGKAEFMLDGGTWTVRLHKAAYEAPATTLVVSGDTQAQYTMSAIGIVPPGDPELCTVYCYCYDNNTMPAPGIQISFQMLLPPPSDTGRAYSGNITTAISNESGLAQAVLRREATYRVRRGTGIWRRFVVADAEYMELPAIVGAEKGL